MTIRGTDVLMMLRPQGGWIISGNEYEDIQFLECEPLTKQEFNNGFAAYEAFKTQQELEKTAAKAALLDRLGITAAEAALLLS